MLDLIRHSLMLTILHVFLLATFRSACFILWRNSNALQRFGNGLWFWRLYWSCWEISKFGRRCITECRLRVGDEYQNSEYHSLRLPLGNQCHPLEMWHIVTFIDIRVFFESYVEPFFFNLLKRSTNFFYWFLLAHLIMLVTEVGILRSVTYRTTPPDIVVAEQTRRQIQD